MLCMQELHLIASDSAEHTLRQHASWTSVIATRNSWNISADIKPQLCSHFTGRKSIRGNEPKSIPLWILCQILWPHTTQVAGNEWIGDVIYFTVSVQCRQGYIHSKFCLLFWEKYFGRKNIVLLYCIIINICISLHIFCLRIGNTQVK